MSSFELRLDEDAREKWEETREVQPKCALGYLISFFGGCRLYDFARSEQ